MFDAGPCSDSIQPFISAQAPEMQKPCGRQIIYKRSLQVSLSQKCVCRRGTHAWVRICESVLILGRRSRREYDGFRLILTSRGYDDGFPNWDAINFVLGRAYSASSALCIKGNVQRTLLPSLLFPEALNTALDNHLFCWSVTRAIIKPSNGIQRIERRNHEHRPYVPHMPNSKRTQPYHGVSDIVSSVYIHKWYICCIWFMAQVFEQKKRTCRHLHCTI